MPEAWAPLETTTTEEVVFLAPLDPVSARGRAKVLFGFDYVWEVYKPEHLRKYGYYTLPVLWGDGSSRASTASSTGHEHVHHPGPVAGRCAELGGEALASNEAFAEALARGFARFVTFLGARELDAKGIRKSRCASAYARSM